MSDIDLNTLRAGFTVSELNDLCIDVIDCPHSTPVWKEHGIRVVRNFNLEDGRISFSKASYVDEATFTERTRRALPEAGDIILSREAPVGAVGLVPNGLTCCLGQRLVLLKVDKSKCSPEYLVAAMSSEFVKTQFQRASQTGSTVSNLTIPELRKLRIPIVRDQELVGEVAQSISDKTKLNNQINENLLAMAISQYMHQFFRKEPNGELSDILTELPKSRVQVGEAKEYTGRFPFFTSGDAILSWDEPMASGRSVLLNTGGNADVKFYVGEMAYSTDTWAVTARDGLVDYMYLLLQAILPGLDMKYFLGTGLRHLQKPLLRKRPIYIPTDSELNEFNSIVVPAMTIISENLRENLRLQELNGWLLPKLMNGQATIAN